MALQNDRIDRDTLARTHPHPVADDDVLQRRIVFVAIGRDAPRRLRREIEQRLDRITGALARAQFQHLADEDQRDDDHRRLEIDGTCPPSIRIASGKQARQECGHHE
jgi:hypothetical protein